MSSTIQTSGLEALEKWALVFWPSDIAAVKEEDKTLTLYEGSIAKMQGHISSLASETRNLRTQLITVESQHREIETLHTAEISALQEEVQSSKASVESMRQEMLETMQGAHEMVRAALSREEAAVKASTKLADARVAAARQEIETQVRAHYITQLQAVSSSTDDEVYRLELLMQKLQETRKIWIDRNCTPQANEWGESISHINGEINNLKLFNKRLKAIK
jgi:uncharacterized protein (DUF3084 family)